MLAKGLREYAVASRVVKETRPKVRISPSFTLSAYLYKVGQLVTFLNLDYTAQSFCKRI